LVVGGRRGKGRAGCVCWGSVTGGDCARMLPQRERQKQTQTMVLMDSILFWIPCFCVCSLQDSVKTSPTDSRLVRGASWHTPHNKSFSESCSRTILVCWAVCGASITDQGRSTTDSKNIRRAQCNEPQNKTFSEARGASS
jgi:hypothetical protein